jgi:alanine-synthesizing transaminase
VRAKERDYEILRGLATLGTVFSRRASRDQTPNAVASALARTGKPRFDLTGTNPTTAELALGDAGEGLLGVLVRAQAESLVYRPEPFGLEPARRAVAELCGAEPEDVLLTASTSEAYAFLFKLLCDPGDQVLVPAPSYPLFEHLAELEAVEAVPYRLSYDGAWHVDLDSLRRAVSQRTRAVIVVSPNNPTGQYCSASERAALSALGLPIISDEVFAPFPLLMPSAPSAPDDGECLHFRLDGLSKRAGAPQLKLGWTLISGPNRLRQAAKARLALIADTFLSVGTPIQRALPGILELCPAITAAIGQRCRENLALLSRLLHDAPVSMLRAEAGWSAVLRLPNVASEEQLVLGLLESEQVLVQPGWFYDFASEPYAVVSLLSEPRLFREGAARLVSYLNRVAS